MWPIRRLRPDRTGAAAGESHSAREHATAAGYPQPTGLVCPVCASSYPPSERFCGHCQVPLVYPDALDGDSQSTVGRRRRQARKIKPQYTDGKLVRVAVALNQPEGELLAGMLLEAGVPSVLRRSAASNVPELMAGGRFDVLVSESGAQAAREVLLQDQPPTA